jgi:hypothetical protein
MIETVADMIVSLDKTNRELDQFLDGDIGDVRYFTSEPDSMYTIHVNNIIRSRNNLKSRLADLNRLEGRLTKAKGPAVSHSLRSPNDVHMDLLTVVKADRLVALSNYQATASMRSLTIGALVGNPQSI